MVSPRRASNVPERHFSQKNETRVPLGIVFMSMGLLVILTVLAIVILSPRAAPASIQSVRHLALLPTIAPTAFVKTFIHQPTPDPNSIRVTAPILLPEYSSDVGRLPSFASAEDAPSTFNPGTGSQPKRLTIPKLGIDAPVSRVQLYSREQDGQTYYQWQVPRSYEIGWHETSALLGTNGNTVLNGHNNIYGQIFRDLIDLEIGEEIIVYDDVRPYTYQVTQREIMPENGQPLEVRLENAKWIKPTSDERLTLVTCWPFTTNSHRLVVIAKPVGRTES